MCNKKKESLDGSLDGSLDDVQQSDSSSFARKRRTDVDENNNDAIRDDRSQTKPTSGGLLSRLKLFVDRNVNCFETEIRWPHVLFMATLHLISLHALIFLILAFKVKLQTIAFTIVLHYLCNIGLTAGVHRLWSHKGE